MKKSLQISFVLLLLFFSSIQSYSYSPSKWQGLYSGTLRGSDNALWIMSVNRNGQVEKLTFFSTKFLKAFGKENAEMVPDSGVYFIWVSDSGIEMNFGPGSTVLGKWVNLRGGRGTIRGTLQRNTAKYSGDYNVLIMNTAYKPGDFFTEASYHIDETGRINETTKIELPNPENLLTSGFINDFGLLILTGGTFYPSHEYSFASLGSIENDILWGAILTNNQFLNAQFVGFRAIPENAQGILTQEQTSQLYVAIFGRASEGEGNMYWRRSNHDMATTANLMLDTTAAKAYFGDTLNDNRAFIEFIYKNTLGKTYKEDPAGIDYWTSRLDQGESKGGVAATLINAAMAPEHKNLPSQKRFINRVKICNYVANLITILPEGSDDLTPFVEFIENIDHSENSVIHAKEKIVYYVASLSKLFR